MPKAAVFSYKEILFQRKLSKKWNRDDISGRQLDRK